ncbi:LysR family transcriptional regulator [Oceanobacter mangrovi]|uniref:LysR family transcriptional regulator n=1 Tax=Oceanobacter mangrovi TaxID=2862510 RepID=UPI001C8EAA2C|nr:LysR family transcriptional regulator [Oceanobacter mangrovi]
MNLVDINLKLLRIYMAVVEMNGIANAQAALNKDASTISRAIARLEEQLGLRLCERGRQGFELTADGDQVYRQAVQLFGALRSFRQHVSELGTPAGGSLAISMIDNLVSDPNCPLPLALQTLVRRYGADIDISLQVHTPAEAERQLAEKRVDVALGIFETPQAWLNYAPLYEEVDKLFCAPHSVVGQLLAAGADETAVRESLLEHDFVTRKFLNSSDLSSLAAQHRGEQIFSSNLEALVILILSGRYVGFVPQHFAEPYLQQGRFVAVLADQLEHKSRLQAAWTPAAGERAIVRELLQLLGAGRVT